MAKKKRPPRPKKEQATFTAKRGGITIIGQGKRAFKKALRRLF